MYKESKGVYVFHPKLTNMFYSFKKAMDMVNFYCDFKNKERRKGDYSTKNITVILP